MWSLEELITLKELAQKQQQNLRVHINSAPEPFVASCVFVHYVFLQECDKRAKQSLSLVPVHVLSGNMGPNDQPWIIDSRHYEIVILAAGILFLLNNPDISLDRANYVISLLF